MRRTRRLFATASGRWGRGGRSSIRWHRVKNGGGGASSGCRGEQSETFVEPGLESVESERQISGGGQFDRQGAAIEGPAQCRDPPGVDALDVAGDRHRSGGEQGDSVATVVGDGESRHGEDPFVGEHQAGPARGQHRHVGAADDEATLDGLLSSFNLVSPTAPSIPAGDAAPTSTAAPSDPLAVLREQVQDHWWGVTITDEEGRCVLESGLDVGAEAEFLVTLLNCGVDMMPADVLDIPSG